MVHRWIAVVAVALALGATASAQYSPPAAVDAALLAAPTSELLRTRLAALAESLAAMAPAEAGRALALRGRSYAREGGPDSAVASLERALALDDRPELRMRLAEALITRLGDGDAERAAQAVRPIQPILSSRPDPGGAPAQALLAWSHYLAGRGDSAAVLFAPIEGWLSPEPEWRYRLACSAVDREDWTRAIQLLTPLAVRARLHDPDVMEMLRISGERLNAARRIQPMLLQALAAADQAEAGHVAGMGARRTAFAAADRFPLGAVLFAPQTRARRQAAIILPAPGDTLAACDSLAIGLRRAGMSVLLLEARGSGRSVGPSCPSHETWRGREAEMQLRVAADVRAAVAALARETGADTTRYLLVGVGSMAPVAVQAAMLDRRAGALLLVSPAPDPVDRGMMRAGIAALRRPVYYAVGPEDQIESQVLDAFYRAGDPRISRIADAETPGQRAGLFRRDPRIMSRFRQWLAEAWPRSTPRAPRPAR